MQQSISTKNNLSKIQFCSLVASLILSTFITPIAVILNKLFGGGYIYFVAMADLAIILSLVLNLKNLKFSNFKMLDWLILSYLALSLIYVFYGLADGKSALALMQGFLTASRFGLVYFAFKIDLLKNLSLKTSKKMLALSLGLIILVSLAQVFKPDVLNYLGYQSSPVKGISTVDGTGLVRAQSLLRGPNPLGAFLLIPLSLAIFSYKSLIKNKKLLILAIGCLVCLVLTWSRSAWLGFGLILIIKALSVIKFNKKVLISGSAALIGLALGFSVYAKTDSFKTVFLHDKPGVGGASTSDDNRLRSYKNALNLIAHKPLGLGIADAGPASVRSNSGVNIVENYYLQIFLQMGWLGGMLFLGIILVVVVSLLKNRKQQSLALVASFLALSLVGIMQPVWADISASVWWWGMFSAWLFNSEKPML
jgi:O-antigen ligase